jgi:hypothetical protein
MYMAKAGRYIQPLTIHLLHKNPATRLLDQVQERVRYLHYSLRTEDAYPPKILSAQLHVLANPVGKCRFFNVASGD